MADIQQLEYTSLPQDLEQRIKDFVQKQKTLLGHGEGPGISYGQEELEAARELFTPFYGNKQIGANETFKLPVEIVDEILTHVGITLNDPYNSVKAQIAKPDVIPPHRDFQRTSTMFYLMSETGPLTNFYDGPEKPDYIIAYLPDSLSNKREYKMEQGKWYSFENAAIHEVVNITSERLSIVIDII